MSEIDGTLFISIEKYWPKKSIAWGKRKSHNLVQCQATAEVCLSSINMTVEGDVIIGGTVLMKNDLLMLMTQDININAN